MRLWQQARDLAATTPPQRNRYVDFLRAVSILFVIFGHWLATTVHFVDGSLTVGHLFRSQPWTQWLTWVFQVMPVFFIVGGYANAVSLDSAARKGIGYAGWLAGRLHRLVVPLLVLLLAWAVLGLVMFALGAAPATLRLGSQAALIPTWFLAIYIMLVVLAPPMYALWRRFGFFSFWLLVALAVSMDFLFFALDLRWLGWSNYFWVWLAIHALGFAWRDARLGGVGRQLLVSAAGLAILWSLVHLGPYPLAMVGSPGQVVSNNTPPKITLLALAIFQFGLLLALERPFRSALENLRLWTLTVLINSMIMSVYLWHMTVMIVLIGVLNLVAGLGLGLEPGSAAWWWSRPLWLALLFGLLLPLALALSPLERSAPPAGTRVVSPPRQVIGAMMICLGIALLALFGIGGGPLPRLDLASLVLVFGGAGVAGLLPRLR